MARKAEPNPIRVVTDPNHESVRVVDQVNLHQPIGSNVSMTLCTFVDVSAGESGFKLEAVVAARIRMNLGMAPALVEGLAKQIAVIEASEGTLNRDAHADPPRASSTAATRRP